MNRRNWKKHLVKLQVNKKQDEMIIWSSPCTAMQMYCNKLLSRLHRPRLFGSMTQLLTHSVAHSTKPSSRPKTDNQCIKKFLSLALSWAKVVKNWTSFYEIKWFENWSFQKMSITKSVPLKSYSSKIIFFMNMNVVT